MSTDTTILRHRLHRGRRRGAFSLIEMLIALAISAALLAATFVSLDASYMAYQNTTEVASTHTVGRLIIERLQTLVRTGRDFGPFPENPHDTIVESDFIEIETPTGEILEIRWDENAQALYLTIDNVDHLLIEGVIPQYDELNNRIKPFTLEYELGRKLHRATIDLAIIPDDNMSVTLDGDRVEVIRLVASAMPRTTAF